MKKTSYIGTIIVIISLVMIFVVNAANLTVNYTEPNSSTSAPSSTSPKQLAINSTSNLSINQTSVGNITVNVTGNVTTVPTSNLTGVCIVGNTTGNATSNVTVNVTGVCIISNNTDNATRQNITNITNITNTTTINTGQGYLHIFISGGATISRDIVYWNDLTPNITNRARVNMDNTLDIVLPPGNYTFALPQGTGSGGTPDGYRPEIRHAVIYDNQKSWLDRPFIGNSISSPSHITPQSVQFVEASIDKNQMPLFGDLSLDTYSITLKSDSSLKQPIIAKINAIMTYSVEGQDEVYVENIQTVDVIQPGRYIYHPNPISSLNLLQTSNESITTNNITIVDYIEYPLY
jgi:hypothetical protein